MDADVGARGLWDSLKSEMCREESRGESDPCLSELKQQHHGGLSTGTLSTDSRPRQTERMAKELIISSAYLVTK